MALTPMIYNCPPMPSGGTKNCGALLAVRTRGTRPILFLRTPVLPVNALHYGYVFGLRFRKSLSLLNVLYRFFNYDCTLQK